MAIRFKQPEKANQSAAGPVPRTAVEAGGGVVSLPPATKFNKREWMRLYMREYRKRAKKGRK